MPHSPLRVTLSEKCLSRRHCHRHHHHHHHLLQKETRAKDVSETKDFDSVTATAAAQSQWTKISRANRPNCCSNWNWELRLNFIFSKKGKTSVTTDAIYLAMKSSSGSGVCALLYLPNTHCQHAPSISASVFDTLLIWGFAGFASPVAEWLAN